MKYLRFLIFISVTFTLSSIVNGQSEFIPSNEKGIKLLLDLSSKVIHSNPDSAIIYANLAIRYAKDRQKPSYISEGYKNLGQTYRYSNRQNKARDAYEKAIEYAKQAKDEAEVARIQPLMAHSFAAESNFKEAMDWQKKSKKYAEESKDTLLMANTSLDIGVIHARKGEFYIAIEYFYKSVEFYEAIGEMKYIVPLLSNIGSIYSDIGEFEKAIIYYEKAEKKVIEDSSVEAQYLAVLHSSVGRCYLNLEDYDEAINRFERAYSHIEDSDNITLLAKTNNLLGVTYLTQGELSRAKDYYNKAYELLKDTNYREELAATLRGLAKVYQKEGKSKKALGYIERANSLNIEVDNLDDIMIDYEILSTIHNTLGNTQKAYDYLLKHMELKDSVNSISNASEIILLESKYNYKQEELRLTNEVENLKKDKILQQSQTTILILALVIVSLILMTLFWFFNRKQKENSLLKKDLENKAIIQQQSDELRILNEELENKVKERTLELQTTNKTLEQANYELRTFNYIASHDIKEPIRVINGYVGLIKRKLPNDLKETLSYYFDTIKRSSTQLYTLVEDFAYYSTLSKGETLKTESIDLNSLVYNVIDGLQESIKKYNGEVLVTNLPTINSNNTFLFTALKNLIENGLKYNKSDKPIVEVFYQKTEKYHQIIISDNGIGIEEKYHDQIFEMFKRLHNRGAYEGSGIGLAIVKLVVEKLGGTVEIESKINKGSRFILQLPK